jgi:hypothetical protein
MHSSVPEILQTHCMKLIRKLKQECFRGKLSYFRRAFLLKLRRYNQKYLYTPLKGTKILKREKCGLLVVPRTVTL